MKKLNGSSRARAPGNATKIMHDKRLVLSHLFFGLLLILLIINTILLVNQCELQHLMWRRSLAQVHDGSTAVRLSIVMPFKAIFRETILDSLKRWQRAGSPCTHRHRIWRSDRVQLIFYVSTLVTNEDHDLVRLAWHSLGKHAGCFTQIKVIGANLTARDDDYPAGPNNMFFKIFHDPATKAIFQSSTHMFWMEHDVTPLRPGWVDALLQEAGKGRFWISGSVYLGDGLDTAVVIPSNWDWIGHINGNALYNLRDEAFDEFLRLVVQYEPPNHFWKPFDVSIWRVLHAFPYTWPLYQEYREKFVHSEYINNWGFHISNKDFAFSHAKSSVFLLHGVNYSAGNQKLRPKPQMNIIWNDRMPKSAMLSIMIRSSATYMAFCYEAVMSVIKFVPNILEIVVVVPNSDVRMFKQNIQKCSTKLVHIVGEARVFDDREVQQKWSKLHADKYCSGNLILHLDSDVVFNRELELRDLLWLGKPVLVYQRYETLKVTGQPLPWQEGTSYALGAPVHHEFTRGPFNVYPKHLYESTRNRIQVMHGKNVTSFLRDFFRNQSLQNSSLAVSEFNLLGAFGYLHAQDAFALAPMDNDDRRLFLLPPPIMKPCLCFANARKAKTPRAFMKLLRSLKYTWRYKLSCDHMAGLTKSLV